MREAPKEGSEKPSMTTLETLSFLKKNGVQPLQDWEPHNSFLYVFEECVREEAVFTKHFPDPANRPSLVRLHDPVGLDFNKPQDYEAVVRPIVFGVFNVSGPVDYYTIRPDGVPILVATSNNTTREYHVTQAGLFSVNDSLFPPSKKKK